MRGFHGDREDGVRQLEIVQRSQATNRFDAAIILAAIYRRDHRPKDAVPLLRMLANTFPRNYIFRLEQVQLYSDLGDKAAALAVLSDIESRLHQRQPGYALLPLERVRYARGNLLFWYGDLDRSLADLKEATRRPDELDLGTAVMAWLRLGQVYDLLGDRGEAHRAYQETITIAPNSDAAKEAAGYIEKPYTRKKRAG
jgi:predicted Zn-dependent protease